MARSRGTARAAAPARPAARTAPPPAPRSAAPPPAPVHHSAPSGGGMMSSMAGMVMQGAAMGTGSAIAHRAVDSMMGPRTVHTEAAPAAAGAAAEAAAPAGAACAPHSKSLMQCLSDNADASACQYYLDALRSCKLNNGLAA